MNSKVYFTFSSFAMLFYLCFLEFSRILFLLRIDRQSTMSETFCYCLQDIATRTLNFPE